MSGYESRRRARGAARAAVVLVGVGALSAACSRGKAEDANAANAPVPVNVGKENVAVVAVSRVQTGPAVSGTLEAAKDATIRAQVSGPVLQVFAEQGQRVTPGMVLARLDDSAIRDSYLSARSGLTSAKSSADVARRELARAEKLLAAGAVAERDVENARRADVAARAALADAQARLSAAAQQLQHTRVTAPFAGVVSERQASAGDVVQPGTALFTVIEPSTMRLEASVPSAQLADVRVGMPVSFTVNGYPGRTFSGRISRVSPTADPVTRQVKILATIPNDGAGLVGGLFAEGRVASEAREGIVVPLSAVDETGLAPAIVRLRGGRAERAQVDLGIRDLAAETVEVRSGIAAGDTVLLGAARAISPGTPVRVSDVNDQQGEPLRKG